MSVLYSQFCSWMLHYKAKSAETRLNSKIEANDGLYIITNNEFYVCQITARFLVEIDSDGRVLEEDRYFRRFSEDC